MAKQIDLYLTDFLARAKDVGTVAREITDMSFGRDQHETPIFSDGGLSPRERLHISSKYPPPFGGAEMPFALFFEKSGRPDVAGTAFHQGDTFASSHGCVHLARTDAEWLFNWTGSDAVAVNIHGPYPSSPVRAHAYARGHTAMLPRVIRSINGRLTELGFLEQDPGDEFAHTTEAAVRAFQASRGLNVDGIVGPSQTAPVLGVRI